MKFLDAAFPQSVGQFQSALAFEQALAFTAYSSGDNALNIWPTSLVQALFAAGYPGMGIAVRGVNGSSGSSDGASDASAWFGFIGGSPNWRLALDIEANIWHAFRSQVLSYAPAWAGAVRSARLSPVLYGVQDMLSTLGGSFDGVWSANQGQGPFWTQGAMPSASQYGSGSFNGVSYDVDLCNFSFVKPSPINMPKEFEVPAFQAQIPAGGKQCFSGLWHGQNGNGTVRSWFAEFYADSADGPGPVAWQAFVNWNGGGGEYNGSQGVSAGCTTQPLGIAPNQVAGLAIYNHGRQPLYVDVHGEDA